MIVYDYDFYDSMAHYAGIKWGSLYIYTIFLGFRVLKHYITLKYIQI